MAAKLHSVIVSDMKHCCICGSPNVVVHHGIPGTANRKLSDEDCLLFPLCPKHHDELHNINGNRTAEYLSKMLAEMAWIKERYKEQAHLPFQPDSEENLWDEFRKRYGKNFL